MIISTWQKDRCTPDIANFFGSLNRYTFLAYQQPRCVCRLCNNLFWNISNKFEGNSY